MKRNKRQRMQFWERAVLSGFNRKTIALNEHTAAQRMEDKSWVMLARARMDMGLCPGCGEKPHETRANGPCPMKRVRGKEITKW